MDTHKLCSSIPNCPDLNNHTEGVLVTNCFNNALSVFLASFYILNCQELVLTHIPLARVRTCTSDVRKLYEDVNKIIK